MPDIALLNEELEQVVARRDALRNEHKGKTMPAGARAEDEQLINRSTELIAILEVEQQKVRDAAADEVREYLTNPRSGIPHAVNADDAGRRTLQLNGWDFRGGMVYRKTRGGGEVAYCPESALFGPLPTSDPVAAAHVKTLRATFQPEYRNAWFSYIAARGDRAVLTGAEQNALSEGVAGDGGYLVPADMQAEILARRADASVMRRLATVRQTSRDRIQFPAVTPNSTSGSIYSSGFVGGLVGERPVNTDVGPTFQQFEIGIKKFEAYTRATNDFIADSISDIMGWLAMDGARNLALVEDNYFLNGVGTGLEPLGLLNAGLTTADVEGTTSNHISNTAADAGSAPKIVALTYLVPAQYANDASWLMARQSQGEVHGLVDGEGRPWWQPAGVAGGASAAPNQLLGAPVYISPFMPVDGTNANKVFVFGDFSAYVIADRTSLSVQIDGVNHIATDETAIYLRSRAGGGIWNTDALRVGIV